MTMKMKLRKGDRVRVLQGKDRGQTGDVMSAIVCPQCGPSRIGYRFDDSGQKIRVCRKCGGDL